MLTTQKMNPLSAYFYTTLLEMYEFADPVKVKLYHSYVCAMDLPPKIQKMYTNAKHKAKYCEDRVTELRRMYSLQYTDGYEAATSDVDKFVYYERLDPMRDKIAESNLLFKNNRERGL
jgi:hypothetical protein